MIKFLKISAVIVLIFLIIFLTLFLSYVIITRDAKLDESKLTGTGQNILIYDDKGNEVISASLTNKHKSVDIEVLSEDTKNAFIASEDRMFYSHHGLNYKRMIKAMFKNIASRSFKEGASTISQQLIKNTHLSQDKTIKRKLNEIKLTKQLEKKYSKNQILEMYLNTIYFGHNCYGLQSAAEFYFDKSAENLTLPESATLVGLLISPNNYSPFKNPEKSLSRRNTVLKSMLQCGYIDETRYAEALNTPLNAKMTNKNEKNSDYMNALFDELEDTDVNFYDLKEGGCKIYTNLNADLQNLIENFDYECDNSIIITSDSGGVLAYKSTINGAKRQPGSTIKPLLVYGPAIEEKILSPFTRILDEKINMNGYSPENYDKKFHGYVSVEDSVKNSYNIPAVKTLNTLTVDTAEKYLTKMNISLDEDEKNLSIALGGMKYGLTLQQITDGYRIFSSGGFYSPSKFIKQILTRNGKIIYKRQPSQTPVFSEGTCSLMNGMLIETSKTGTAKKLREIKYDVATKTGTCGNLEGNTDAYAISYTSEHNIGIWLGDRNNARLDVTGGRDCCDILNEIYRNLYNSHTPVRLETDKGTQTVEIDAEEYYDNNKILKSDPLSPKINNLKVKVLQGNEPDSVSKRFSSPTIQLPEIAVKNCKVFIKLCQTKYYSYLIKREKNGKITEIYNGKWKEIISDSPDDGYYTYTVTPYYYDGTNKIYGQEIVLPSVNLTKNDSSPQVKIPDISQKNWYDL